MTLGRILYVEDDDDIRDTLAMLLEHEGYRVRAVATAEAALAELEHEHERERGGFDLLLTDYQLPGGNAAWLVETAKAHGTLRDLPVIVLSGAYAPEGIDGYRLLRKPVSQERLLDAIETALPPPVTPPASAAVADGAALRLVLYVSGTSDASRKAQRNLERVLEGLDPATVELVLHDVTGDDPSWVSSADDDRVVVLPTLVRVAPLPKVWIAGDLSKLDVVRDALVPLAMAPAK